ncbi:MAG: hypothetical protein JWP97_6077 [Labilithrix sp.]|nr:hypothetical protein [Labilithrix sp.]
MLSPWLVRTFRYLFALLAVGVLGQGCSDDPSVLTNGRRSYAAGTADPGENGGADEADEPDPVQTTPSAPASDSSWSARTLARARQWIDVDMPYCGGPNGGHDVICGGTCVRNGGAKTDDWDDYRSDCSGFVSWSWGLAPPGETTRTLAPYSTHVSSLIAVDDLEPGDALNGAGHVMLFGGWADKERGTAHILQESRCGTTASEKISTFTVVNETTLRISDGRLFRPIRYKGAK